MQAFWPWAAGRDALKHCTTEGRSYRRLHTPMFGVRSSPNAFCFSVRCSELSIFLSPKS